MHQSARTDSLEIGNSENNENCIFEIKNSESHDDSLETGNSEIQENPENCERLDLCEDPSDIRRKNLNRPIIRHINMFSRK